MPARDWGGRSHRPPHLLHTPDRVVGRWSARRMSRRFAHVGVDIPGSRLRQILAGAPTGYQESVDVNFALAATGIRYADRRARVRRTRQRAVHWLLVAGLVIAALNVLICVGYGVLSLALHDPAM